MSADDLLRILLAIAIGGAIGIERELRHKAAGLRTVIFVCLGSTLFTMMSIRLAGPGDDPTRIASAIVTGVGFLGAGAILQHGTQVLGLTTAATVWLVAALGMAVGAGHYALALAVTASTLVVLSLFPALERWIDRFH